MRIRTTQACAYCRKKKIKCDGEKPECKHCRNTSVQCEYTSSKKRGPRKGYVQVLEERLNQMEKKLMHPKIVVNKTNNDNASITHDEIDPPIQLYKSPRRNSSLPSIEIITHLTDLFFEHINSVFFFVHRPTFMKSIHNGTVSERLLYSIMALGSRFSDHPSIRASPPYVSGNYYAQKAYSLIDGDAMEPCLKNIPFWAIMSFLEYGRASGPKSWIYGSMAIRICQELQYHKEEVLSTPILNEEGNIDYISMSSRRHLFWTCYYIDKLSSAGTHRPQCIERTEVDARPPTVSEVKIIQDSSDTFNVYDEKISDDSLLNISPYFVHIVDLFGDVNRCMIRASNSPTSINWPPIPEFRNLDSLLRSWVDTLPESYQFNTVNFDYHRKNASIAFFNDWLFSHALWCSSMMLLHRGSLVFSNLKLHNASEDFYGKVQSSVNACRACVDLGVDVFAAICNTCGFNTSPFFGYSSYIFSTILMTSTFSGTPELYKRSSGGLKTLYQLVNKLAPYWSVCEKIAKTIHDLMGAHQSLYNISGDSRRCSFESNGVNEVELSYSCQTSVNSLTPPTNSPVGLRISVPPSPSISPPTQSFSSIALSPASNLSNSLPEFFSPLKTDMLPPSSVSPTVLDSTNGTYNRKDSTEYTAFLSPTDMTLSDMMNSIPTISEPLPSTLGSDNNSNDLVNMNNFGVFYDNSMFGQTAFDSSSLFASSEDPVPDMSHTSSITRESLDSEYESLLMDGYTVEEQLSSSYGSTKSQWHPLVI